MQAAICILMILALTLGIAGKKVSVSTLTRRKRHLFAQDDPEKEPE